VSPLPASSATSPEDQADALLRLYDRALPQVYGYLHQRCGSAATAEDLTSETFMAAVDAVQRRTVPDLTVGWLIGVARHKLADHWRAAAREERKLAAVEADDVVDDWDVLLDAARAHEVLAALGPHHRAALTFRYLDGLPVNDVAECLGRTVHATEALLVRARRAFRGAYDDGPERPTRAPNRPPNRRPNRPPTRDQERGSDAG
jgi:RNA polymerase sigma-70 factor (ECF subfamily)